MIVNPVPKPETWNIPDKIRHRIILPWEKKRLTGRPKKSMIPSAGEFRKQKLCSNCGGKGHNKRSCPNPSCSTSKLLKKTRACSVCKQGHNRLKCPNKAPDTNSNDTDDELIDC
ncbi:hypothetical protein Ddye_000218 [Dipteronia dyeriana]|uniref:CCHC-type domain-containing protein n=1 Tax=Dipteronia dyeriana TaxID=168575 RepID=A0AAE0CSE4_9ROSI|nr:hypothetical protein Ddye_000218 [Dipteronia dyeriana]